MWIRRCCGTGRRGRECKRLLMDFWMKRLKIKVMARGAHCWKEVQIGVRINKVLV